MDDEPIEIIDSEGVIRRPGSWAKPEGFVSSLPPTDVSGSPVPIWNDSEILEALSDPGRRKTDDLFGDETISDQGSTSACNGHATANALARCRYLRGVTTTFEMMSGSYLYGKCNGGKDNGSSLECTLKAVQQYGTCSEKLCPPNLVYPSQQPLSASAAASMHKGAVAYWCQTKQAWRSALAAGFMANGVVMAGSAFSTFTSINSGSRCVKKCGVTNGTGNHSICVADMRLIDGIEHYLIVNSWKYTWGSHGMAWVTWSSFEQCFGTHDFFVIPTTSESAAPIGSSA